MLCIVFDFVTCESNYFDSLSIEPLGSDSIFVDTFLSEVWQSIAFEHKPRFRAEKIDDVMPEFMLSTKFGLATLTVSNELPHQVFRRRRGAA